MEHRRHARSLQSRRAVSRRAGIRRLSGAARPPGPRQEWTNPQDARIWDWRALEPQLQQIQGLRPYYTFSGVDIDRYIIDGAERQVLITARELNLDKLPDQAKVWVNLALKYTHGYGAVAVPVNEMDSRGNPVLWALRLASALNSVA